ncbi:MAG: carbohydrate ABC transporter permease, partial [Candidatus Thalassarchaeaceae archaeon]
YYSDESFSNLSEIVPTASSVAGFPDAWIFVSEDQADDPSIQETLKFFRCWWSPTIIPETLATDFQVEEGWFEPTFSIGMPVIPPDATSVVCDLPGIVRGQEVYVATVAIDEDGRSVTEGLEVLSAITTAESERPPDPDMTRVYIAIGVIVGGLSLTAIVLYFLSPSRRERSGYLFVLPAILLLATLTFYPVGYGIYLSFTDESAENYGEGEFIGLDNYELLFSDERDYDGDGDPGFWRTFTFTLIWTFGCVIM